MEDLIVVKQLPVIEQHLKALSKDIDKQVRDALSLAVTEDTVKSVKVVRADLNKQYKALEDQRKAVKKAILEPYEAFDKIYREYVAIRFEEGDAELKRKINAVENQLKQEKEDDLRSFFRELADTEGLPWLEFERANINVTMSKSRSALLGEAEVFVEKVSGDVTAIRALPDAEEILVEYKNTLNIGNAVETVRRRREAVERERQERERLAEIRKAEEEAAKRAEEAVEVAAPPTPVPEKKEETDPVRTLTFTVTAPLSKLRDLKRFLTEGGYQIG